MSGTSVLIEQLNNNGIPFIQDEPLAAHTTFRIGGPAKLFVCPKDERQMIDCFRASRACGVKYYVLGNGSNTLFADNGFDGAVIDTSGLSEIHLLDDDIVYAECGALLVKVCTFALKNSLSGLEFAYGIPGYLGGAVYMDAGAYGGEMKDVVKSVRAADCDGNILEFSGEDLQFGYRTSAFEKNGMLILSAELKLQKKGPDEIKEKMDDLLSRRAEKQPLDKPSAGSTFKRPQGAYAAALIEQCGLKGFQIGGAAVSTKHSGFVVNLGGATAADVIAVADEVSRIVKEKTGFTLEREIRVVGE